MVSIRPMTPADVADGLRLSAEAGWNQVEADWRRCLDLGGEGNFVAESGGRVVGSVTSCLFGSVGWIAMLLVERARRGAGIGRSLLTRGLAHLEAAGARSIRLDATPEGRPLYESFGFRVDFPLHRYRGVVRHPEVADGTRPGGPDDRPRIADLDRDATGTDRRELLDRLARLHPLNWRVAGPVGGPVRGFVLWRPGAAADQIGPCVAGRDAGRALLDAAASRLAGRSVLVDLPDDHAEAVAWAEGRGLTQTRAFWRMTRGEAVAEDRARLWASSGPEMG